jgi:hypothetical protein
VSQTGLRILVTASAAAVTGDEANDEGRDGTGRYRDDQCFKGEKHLGRFNDLKI